MPSQATVKWIKDNIKNKRLNIQLRSIFMNNVNDEENMKEMMNNIEWEGEYLKSSKRGRMLVNSYIRAKYKQIS